MAIHKEVEMPRPHRIHLAGVPQHIVQRGVDRQAVFFADTDRQFFLKTLAETASWYGMQVHAYCLMTNHFHLLVTPSERDALSRVMQGLGSQYVAFVNRRYDRIGALWSGRFRSCLVDTEHYFLVCQRYIELNPVRAGMVKGPEKYHWSSFRHNGLGIPSELVIPHAAYTNLADTKEQRCATYRLLFDEALDANELQSVRESLQHNQVLGSDRFKRQIERIFARKLSTGKRGRPRKLPSSGSDTHVRSDVEET